MLGSILIAMLIAKLKKHQILPVFKTISLYPLFAVELFYIFCQVMVYTGNYQFLQYVSLLRILYMAVMLLPMLQYALYKPALVGSGMVVVGTLLNKLVMSLNGGKMPVFPTLSLYTGYFSVSALEQSGDSVHTLGTADTVCKILTDYIDVGFSVLSIGDVLIHGFTALMVYYTIKAVSQKTIASGG